MNSTQYRALASDLYILETFYIDYLICTFGRRDYTNIRLDVRDVFNKAR
jgi:hypothetical protein